jgi:hypothetical protein
MGSWMVVATPRQQSENAAIITPGAMVFFVQLRVLRVFVVRFKN